MRHRDHDMDIRQRRFRDDPERTPWSDDWSERPASSRHQDIDRQSSADYSAIRASPGRYVSAPSGLGPAGYGPRDSEQEFLPAWDDRNTGSYGRTYGSTSRVASPASHRGRGPRGFVRSDSRIGEELNERLTDDDVIDASDISVSVESGVATLEGHVAQRWMKHRAEDIAAHCGGVSDVVNRLRVKRDDMQEDHSRAE